MIELKNITTFFGDKPIHNSIDLVLAPGRVHVLMGPSGGGKSSLLKIIAQPDAVPAPGVITGSVLVSGSEEYCNSDFALVGQTVAMFTKRGIDVLVESIHEGHLYTRAYKEKLVEDFILENGLPLTKDQLHSSFTLLPYCKKTILLIAAAALSRATYILIDEPTSKVNEQEAIEVLQAISCLRSLDKTPVLVLHNQKHARLIADEVHLMAGGRIIESSSSEDFFSTADSEIKSTFLKTGSCSLPSPGTPSSELSEIGRLYKKIFDSDSPQPTGFYWLLADSLAGCMRPGLLCSEENDLSRLMALGITTVVCLEEEATIHSSTLQDYGFTSIHFPIADMGAPSDLDGFIEFIHQLHQRICNGEVIAVHCKAGLGRTGTLLAAYIAITDSSVADPIQYVRQINARWIQSDEQEAFVRQLHSSTQPVIHNHM